MTPFTHLYRQGTPCLYSTTQSLNHPILPHKKQHNAKIILIWLLKIALFVLLAYIIYQQIFGRADIEDIRDQWQQLWNWQSSIGLLLVIILMGINWGIETYKWQQLIRKIEDISFKRAIQAVMCGVSLSFFTPNRVGEYGGRVLLLQIGNKLQGIALTLVGSLSQWVANVSIGIIGFCTFVIYYGSLSLVWVIPLVTCSLLILLLSALCYFHLDWLQHLKKYFPFFERFNKYLAPLQAFQTRELAFFLVLSYLRYGIYTLQYILLIALFGIDTSIGIALIMVTSIFFIQTIVPSIALIELGIRGNVALFFWGLITTQNIAILAATFTLWIINLVIPASIGMFLFFSLKKVIPTLNSATHQRS